MRLFGMELLLSLIPGRAFGSLKFNLTHEIAQWKKSNTTLQELRYSLIHRILLVAGNSPFKAAVGLLILATLASMLTFFSLREKWIPEHWKFLPYPADLKAQEAFAYLSSLWSAQVTTVGLVYPIVIAFVTLRLQQESSSKTQLHMYLHDSIALFAGISSLFLVANIGIQFLLAPYISVETILGLTAIDGIWFVLNIALTAFFLIRTFDFIRPNKRVSMIKRYATNVCWPIEVTAHLANNIFRMAIERKLLPGPRYGSESEPNKPSVLLGFMGFKLGTDEVTRNFDTEMVVVDVRFKLLAYVVNRWERRVAAEPVKKTSANTLTSLRRAPIICFTLQPFNSYKGGTVLCSIDGDVRLNWWESKLIKYAFVFKRAAQLKPDILINDILLELQIDAVSLMARDTQQALESAARNLSDLYQALVEVSEIRYDNGEVSNLSLISDRYHHFESPVYTNWSRHFLNLFSAASMQITTNPLAIKSLIHLPGRLFQKLRAPELRVQRKHLIFILSQGLNKIDEWWLSAIAEQGQSNLSIYKSASLKGPAKVNHDGAVREFVGTWQSLKAYHFYTLGNAGNNWDNLLETAEYFQYHLEISVQLLLRAVYTGNEATAEKMCDVLVSWDARLERNSLIHKAVFLRKPYLFTVELLKKDWSSAQALIALHSAGAPSDITELNVVEACLDNYRTDLISVVCYIISIWGNNSQETSNLSLRIQKALTFTARIEGVGAPAPRPLFLNIDAFFLSIFRQYYVDGQYNEGYRKQLDDIVEKIQEIRKAPLISGEIQPRWGSDDLRSIQDGQIFVFLLLVKAQSSIQNELKSVMPSFARTNDEKVREFKAQIADWRQRIVAQEFKEYFEGTYSICKTAYGLEFDFPDACEKAVALLENLEAELASLHDAAVENAKVDENRLQEISRWCSSEAFTDVDAFFPLSIIKDIQEVKDVLEKKSLQINELEKGQFTTPALSPIVANEEEWYRDLLKTQVAAWVLHDFIKLTAPEPVDAQTPELYWDVLSNYSKLIAADNLQPVLLVETGATPDWIFDWLIGDKSKVYTPPDMVVSEATSAGVDGYIGRINNIKIFTAPLQPGASYLLVEEVLEKVKFSRQPNGEIVLVEYVDVPGQPALVNLVLSWQQKVEGKAHPAYKLNYGGQS